MPAAPLVGAVTTWPPAAFSSLTASAQALTHSIASTGPPGASASSMRCSRGARRGTFRTPGSTPSRRKSALHAGLHDAPDPREPARRSRPAAQRALVPSISPSIVESALRGSAPAARRRSANGSGSRRAPPRLRRGPRRRAARRRRRSNTSPRASSVRAFGIARREAHAIRMARQHLVALEQQIHRLVEGDLVAAQQPQPAAAADARECRLHDRRIESGRIVSLEAQQDGAIGAVPETRQRQRAVELREDLGRALKQVARRQVLHEHARGQHRPHRVRRRRADTDLEDVEYREIHSAARRRSIRPASSSASAARNDCSSCSLASTAVSS